MTDLSQSALQASEEVIVIQATGGIVDVIHHELELLYLLKTIVYLDHLAELRVERVLDPLCPCQLQRKDRKYVE